MRRKAEGPRPQQAHREPTRRIPRQAPHRIGREHRDEVAAGSQNTAPDHRGDQRNVPPPEPIGEPADPHERREHARAGNVPQHLGQPESLLREERGPLRHRELGGTRAEHQHQGGQECACPEERRQRHAVLIRHRRWKRDAKEDGQIDERNDGPDQREELPSFLSHLREDQRGSEHHRNLPPAVEGVQKAHRGGLALLRARQRVDDRADQHFEQTTSDRVHDDRGAQAKVRRGQHGRRHREQHQPSDTENVRQDQWNPVARALHHLHRNQIGDELGDEVEQYEPTQHLVGDLVPGLKDDEEQRRQVVRDRLRDVSGVAGAAGVLERHD
jgi:hypothetical protein